MPRTARRTNVRRNKTLLLTFMAGCEYPFSKEVAPLKGIEVLPYSDEKQKIYQEIERDYDSGSTRMTARPQDVNQASSVSYSFFVDHPQFSPERLVHIYDIAGEVFTNNTL